MLSVGSLFSGIGGIDLGLEQAGMRVVFQAESDEYRRRVLAARFPGVTCHDDVRSVQLERERDTGASLSDPRERRRAIRDSPVDLICGGFPCQDLSVAGRRRGLAGERSGLFFEFARIADTLRPRYCLVENVPGLLSSDGGRDFGVVLGTLADIGYGLGWRILDSRFFGVPQRRRRVFILGVLAEHDSRAAAECAGEILAVGSRCEGHLAKGTQAREELAPTLGASVGGGRGWDANPDRTALIAPPLTRSMAEGDPPDQVAYVHSGGETYNESEQVGSLAQQSASETSAMTPLVANTLKSQSGRGWSHDAEANYVAVPLSHGSNSNSNMAGRRREDDENLVSYGFNTGRGQNNDDCTKEEEAPPITGRHGDPGGVFRGSMVRRLTPTECERLQGFPDGWTQLGDTPDSRRYAALGDAVTVPVAYWLGRRILAYA